MSEHRRGIKFTIGRLIFLAVTVGLLGLAALNWQAIYDEVQYQRYDPTPAIEQLANDTTMKKHARKLFYAQRPALEDQAAFNQHCTHNEETIVLGCYIRNSGIYIFDVKDERLAGVEQVTAAHEMLHAAYDRLKNGEKTRVNSLLNEAYKDVDNQRIRNTIEEYRKRGDNVTNELHSILGTEVRDLPFELEAYYQKYFDNRAKVVGYAEAYEKVFDEPQAQLDQLLVQINDLKGQLASEKASIEALEASLKAQEQQMQSQRQQGQIEAYNAQVGGFNAKVATLQQEIAAYNQKVENLNSLIQIYSQLSDTQAELYQSLNSQAAPVSR